MRIVVCVKQVPEVAELDLDPVTRRLRRDGVPLQINPFDRRAVLEATRLRAELGGSITVLSMGPPQTADALRECLSLGVDRAIHLCDRGFAGADTLATARALSRAIERIGYDLVLAGRFSIDSETGQVAPELAALLDASLLSGVRRLTIAARDGGGWSAQAECERDDGFAEVDCPLPLVATCTDRWKSRVPLVMPDDDAAQTRPLETWSIADLGGGPEDYGQAGSPTWVADVSPVESRRERRVLVASDTLDDAVDAVVAELAALRDDVARVPRIASLTHARREDPEGSVWVLAERDAAGRLRRVTSELLGAADRLAARLGVAVCVYPIAPELPDGVGQGGAATSLASELGRLGADVLLWPVAGASTMRGE